jgi:hypothetical protein
MKYALFVVVSLHCFLASAQIVSKPLSCSKYFLGFPFEVHFMGNSVAVSFKNETYTLPFNRSWVTIDGGRWSDYTNGTLILASSYPEEPYVSLSLKNQKNSMASCDVVETSTNQSTSK